MTEQQQLIESPRIACALGSNPIAKSPPSRSIVPLHLIFNIIEVQLSLSTHQIVFLQIIGIEPQTSLGIL
jgi:hypothetical protein